MLAPPAQKKRSGIPYIAVTEKKERGRTAFMSHAKSHCIPVAYGRWQFIITPTSGRRIAVPMTLPRRK